eukprot:Lankesteria_metandrocarpae@DN5423_c0_g1_i14.p1
MVELYILYENAAGYALGHVKEWDRIAQDNPAVLAACADPQRFGQILELKAFHPFKNAGEALENMNAVVSGTSTALLRSFLDQNLPKKRKRCQIGVSDIALGKDLTGYGFPVIADKVNVNELVRGCRLHHQRLLKGHTSIHLQKFQVGLGHSYSRGRIQFDPKRQDKPVQQAIALLDSIDKSLNMFSMRLREWYCWHFPELQKIVTDHCIFAKIVQVIKRRDTFDNSKIPALLEVLSGNEGLVEEIQQAMRVTLGQDIVEADMANIDYFAGQVIKMTTQRAHLVDYLSARFGTVAPNLRAVVGDPLAARLISHAGSLESLAKYPASTVQIIGAEKALFRALKSKGKTPKYGLLFQSSFIGKANLKNKGKHACVLCDTLKLGRFHHRPHFEVLG